MTAPQPPEVELWRGKPGRYPVFTRYDLLLVPFQIAFLAFVGYGFIWRSANDGDKTGVVGGTIACVLVLGQGIGRLVLRQLTLRSAEYVVTDRHVVVVTKVFGRERTQAVPMRRIEPPVLAESADGTGSITFGDTSLFDGVSGRGDTADRESQPPELVRIPDARRVRDLIAEARRAAVAGGR
ncbi:MAG TPA: hypothetical protein VNO31_31340 [Umezawaea sp.]|nr:hypothetical protein [Umezawaea sp.]